MHSNMMNDGEDDFDDDDSFANFKKKELKK